MADRTVKVILDASITGLQSKMKAAAGSVKDFSSNTSKYLKDHEQSVSAVSSGLIKFGALGVAAAGLAIKKFADFDAAMSSVKAATHESTENMGLLREAAIAAGADTQYSATEAAGAIEELAKAGISTKDILGGGLAGSLNLAAAGAMDVSSAAESAASALVMFGLKGSDVNHVADLLAAGAGKAQGEVSDLSAALNNVGTVASNTGLSIEETTGFLAAMASYGLTGAEAGTQFKSMLLSLQGPSSTAQKALDELGLSLYDNAGNTKSLTQFVGEYKAALQGKTQAEKDSYNSTIFGSYGINAANVAYKEGADGIQSWISAVDDSGFAAETAAAKTDNLKGDIERLGGSLETAFIKGGTGANDVLRGITQGAEAAVDAIGGMPGPILSATTLLVGAGGLTTMGIGGLGKLAIGINNAKAAVTGLGISLKTAGIAAGAVGAAIAVGTLALASWAQHAAEAKARTEGYIDTLDSLGNITDSTMSAINKALSDDNRNWAEKMFGDGGAKSLIDDAETLGLSVDDLTGYITGNKASVDKLNAAWAEYSKQGGSSSFAFDQFKGSLDDQANSLTNAQKQALQKAQADKDAGIASEDSAASTDVATAAIENQAQSLQDLLDIQKEAAGIAMSVDEAQGAWGSQVTDNAEAVQKLAGYTNEAGDRVSELGRVTTGGGAAWDVFTEAGQLANSTMLDTSKQAWNLIDSLKAQNASEADLRASMQTSRDEFIKTATQMGMNETAAKALADRYGLIPSRVTTTVNAVTDDARRKIDAVIAQIASLPLHKTVTVEALTYATTYAQTIYSASGPSGSGNALHRGKAAGGPIYGPGTGTSDTAGLFRLSNGEHVLTAAEVAGAGGQSAIYALRAAVRRDGVDAVRRAIGAPGYASGGAVPREARVMPSYMSQPSVNVAAPSMEGLALTGSLNVNGVLVPLVDARIERQQKRFARGAR